MPPRSPRRFLILFAVIFITALLPLLLVFGMQVGSPQTLDSEALRVANEVDRLLQLRMREVFTLSAFPSTRAFASSTPDARAARAAVSLNELKAWVAADTNVREAFIVDPQGLVIMTTGEGWNVDWHNRAFVRQALAGKITVSAVAHDRGEFSIYYAAPILNNTRDIAGALAARLSAQELWDALPHDTAWYTVLVDEQGIRLGDSSDPARRLTAFGLLTPTEKGRIVEEQTYGSETLTLRTDNYPRAQELLVSGALDSLHASDIGAPTLAARRLTSMPWSVLLIGNQPSETPPVLQLGITVLVALVLSLAAAWILSR